MVADQSLRRVGVIETVGRENDRRIGKILVQDRVGVDGMGGNARLSVAGLARRTEREVGGVGGRSHEHRHMGWLADREAACDSSEGLGHSSGKIPFWHRSAIRCC